MNEDIFVDGKTNDEKFLMFKEFIKSMEKKHKILFFVDILLNHTSTDSEWLLKDDNSYYNLLNTKRLNVAY